MWIELSIDVVHILHCNNPDELISHPDGSERPRFVHKPPHKKNHLGTVLQQCPNILFSGSPVQQWQFSFLTLCCPLLLFNEIISEPVEHAELANRPRRCYLAGNQSSCHHLHLVLARGMKLETLFLLVFCWCFTFLV